MKIYNLQLDMPLHPRNLSGFRAAIVELLGREYEMLHNHDNSEKKAHYHWSYPLLQYKVIRGKAAIVAIGEQAKQLCIMLMQQMPDQLFFAKQVHPIKAYFFKHQNYEWSLQAIPESYYIKHWLALNKTNYTNWKKSPDHNEQNHILSNALTGHIRAFARSIQLDFEAQIEGKVLQVNNYKAMQWHGQTFVGFNALIQSNLSLPLGIGLGRCVAFGFGEILAN